jgi:hypothetical protein
MDRLHEKGWVVDPRSKAKSVVLTEDGERLAPGFLQRHFGSHRTAADSRAVGGSPQETIATGRRARQQPQHEGSRAGAVLYAKSVDRVVAFYSAVLGFQIRGGDESHVVLESAGFQLVILHIPEQIASSIVITVPLINDN